MYIYDAISSAKSLEALSQIENELEENFGPLPDPVINLVYIVRLQNGFSQTCVKKISVRDKYVKFEVDADQLIEVSRILVKNGVKLNIKDEQSLIIVSGEEQKTRSM